MTRYLHERKNWPRFRFSLKRLAARLAYVQYRQGRLSGRMEGLPAPVRARAALLTLIDDIQASDALGGVTLAAAELEAALGRQLGADVPAPSPAPSHAPAPAPSPAPADTAVEAAVGMALDATRTCAEPLTAARLCAWHASLFAHAASPPGTVGAWRPHVRRPMPLSSDPVQRAHIPLPAPERLDRDMRGFLEWYNSTSPLDPVLKAGVAHLWLAALRPFDDGNGRIVRAITDRLLTGSAPGGERFFSLSAQLYLEQDAYAATLETTETGGLDITPWLVWFLGCLDRALDTAGERLAPVLRTAQFWGAHAGAAFTPRQRAMLDRLLEGLEGDLTTSRWAGLAGCSQDTALREIDDLLRRGILAKTPGGGRSTRYVLAGAA